MVKDYEKNNPLPFVPINTQNWVDVISCIGILILSLQTFLTVSSFCFLSRLTGRTQEEIQTIVFIYLLNSSKVTHVLAHGGR